MIVNKSVLGQIAPRWVKEGLFASRWENIVAGWCVNYFNKYGKSPRKAIEDIFQSWSEDHHDKSDVSLVARLLDQLSGKYVRESKHINPDFLVDKAAELFNKVRLEKLASAIRGDLELGNISKAQTHLDKTRPVEIGAGVGVRVFSDYDALRKAFKDKKKPLIVPEDPAMRAFLDDSFERDAFICLEAPEKRGKSFWLMYFAWQAMLHGRRVAIFQCGDLSLNQALRRIYVMAANRPWKARTLQIPTGLTVDKKGVPMVKTKEKTWQDPLTISEGIRALKRIKKENKFDYEPFMLAAFANDSINMDGLESTLDGWERRYDWTPDMIVIDYMDILAPMGSMTESRETINKNWKRGRKMASERKALVLTVSQVKAASYEQEILDETSFSEDKRKRAHTSGTIGLNQKVEEKRIGVYRLNWFFRREEEFDKERCLYTAGCLGLGNPAMFCKF